MTFTVALWTLGAICQYDGRPRSHCNHTAWHSLHDRFDADLSPLQAKHTGPSNRMVLFFCLRPAHPKNLAIRLGSAWAAPLRPPSSKNLTLRPAASKNLTMAIYYDKQSKLELFEKVIATLGNKLAIYYARTKKDQPIGLVL